MFYAVTVETAVWNAACALEGGAFATATFSWFAKPFWLVESFTPAVTAAVVVENQELARAVKLEVPQLWVEVITH